MPAQVPKGKFDASGGKTWLGPGPRPNPDPRIAYSNVMMSRNLAPGVPNGPRDPMQGLDDPTKRLKAVQSGAFAERLNKRWNTNGR